MFMTRITRNAALLTSLMALAGCATQQPVHEPVVVVQKVAPEPEPEVVEQSSPQEDALAQALDQLGARYRYGGASPQAGFDCSGLVHYAFQNTLSVDLPRSSRAMSRMDQPTVKRADLQPGDLIFFKIGGQVSHVGMYVGDDQFLHANRSGGKVRIDNLSDRYWQNHFFLAKRVEVEVEAADATASLSLD